MKKTYFIIPVLCALLLQSTAAFAESRKDVGRPEDKVRPAVTREEEKRPTPMPLGDKDWKRNDAVKGKAFVGIVNTVGTTSFTMKLTARYEGASTGTVFTVDTTNAKFLQSGIVESGTSTATTTGSSTPATISQLVSGARVLVNGTIEGTTITAKNVHIGIPARAEKRVEDRKEKRPEVRPIDLIQQGDGQPVIVGIVGTTTGSSTTFVLTNKNNVAYTIDAANAKVYLKAATGTVADIKTGDRVVVQGTVTGTSIVATTVIDHGQVALKRIDDKTGLVKPTIAEKVKGFFKKFF
jgi:uncharacterized cupin superfamily protein